eukprot:GHVS01053907.1.p1 GENE.GHVS01053907.1~~GHVS01053907.1.p1  ORF type:complete len:173 (+),score=31.27 GHVS01053907.1:3-521(+)
MQRFQSVSDIAAEDTEIARMAMQRFQSVSDIAAEDADFQQPLEALHGGQPTDGDHLPELQRSKSVDTLLDDRTTVRGAAKLEVEEEDHSSSPDDTDDGCSSTEQHQKPTDVLDGDCLVTVHYLLLLACGGLSTATACVVGTPIRELGCTLIGPRCQLAAVLCHCGWVKISGG